jgi:uncharacterized protein
MQKLEWNGILQAALGVLSLGVLAGLAAIWFQSSKTQHLTLAAGTRSGESYILSGALKKVTERRFSNVRITLMETGGTAENLRMLEDGKAQLATAQADVLPGAAARIVAVLYDDEFQLLTPKDSPVQRFADLRGRVIALAQSGGQFPSFLHVAEHFGLHQEDFRFAGANDAAAEEAFREGQADAIFRVRALGNPTIQRLAQTGKFRFLAIEQAAAMQINQPAFEPAVIPAGAYSGSPSVPAQDLPTIAVHRTLLAHYAADENAIRAITSVLLERRQEIMEAIPSEMTEVRLLLAQVRQPQAQVGLEPAIHPGALSFYNKDKPSFLQAHADFVGLLLTVSLMVGSWIWELKRLIQTQQKNAADRYSDRAISLMTAAQGATSRDALDGAWNELLTLLTDAVRDLDADKLSEESFDSFRSILQIAMDATKERRAVLAAASVAAARV